MERSPIKDVELKVLLKGALTDEINSREVYMKGIDSSYHYEGYNAYKAEKLWNRVLWFASNMDNNKWNNAIQGELLNERQFNIK